jgi:hypothetical protein
MNVPEKPLAPTRGATTYLAVLTVKCGGTPGGDPVWGTGNQEHSQLESPDLMFKTTRFIPYQNICSNFGRKTLDLNVYSRYDRRNY